MSAEERDNTIDTANPGEEVADSSLQPAPPDLHLLDQALAPIPSPNADPPRPIVPLPFPSPNHFHPSQHNDFDDDPYDELATNPPPPPSRSSKPSNQSPPAATTTSDNQQPVALEPTRAQDHPAHVALVDAHPTPAADGWNLSTDPAQPPINGNTGTVSVPRPLAVSPSSPFDAVPSSASSLNDETLEPRLQTPDAPSDTASSNNTNDNVDPSTPQPGIYDEPDKLMGATAVVQAMRIIAVGDFQDISAPSSSKRTSTSDFEWQPDDEDGPDTPRLPTTRNRAGFEAHQDQSPTEATAAVLPPSPRASFPDIIPELDPYESVDTEAHHDDEELEPEEVIAETPDRADSPISPHVPVTSAAHVAPVTQAAELPSVSASAPPPPIHAVSSSQRAMNDTASDELLEIDLAVEAPHVHPEEVLPPPPPPPPSIAEASPAVLPNTTAATEQSSEKSSTKPGPKKPPRKGRQGWEIAFADEFVRAYPKLKPRQLETEVSFIERSLGIQQGGVLLDLGCGFGQHAVELASRGYNVVGYDLSLTMLAMASDEAHERGQKINFLHGDMRDMAFDQLFDGVYCWSTSFGFFDEETNISVIRRVHRALRQGGMFLLDIINRDYVCTRLPTLVWFEGDGCVCIDDAQFNSFTSRIRVKRTIMTDDGMSREVEYTVRLYSLHEIGKILHEAGFKVVEVSGHPASAGAFFDAESPRVIALAVRR